MEILLTTSKVCLITNWHHDLKMYPLTLCSVLFVNSDMVIWEDNTSIYALIFHPVYFFLTVSFMLAVTCIFPFLQVKQGSSIPHNQKTLHCLIISDVLGFRFLHRPVNYVSLADNHGGDSLHILQPIRVKVHQELPHPCPHG